MKKTKWLALAFFAAVSLAFTGCSTAAGGDSGSSSNNNNNNNNNNSDTSPTGIDKLMSVNFARARYVANEKVEKTAVQSSIRSARAADGESENFINGLIVVNDDGSINTKALELSAEIKAKLDLTKQHPIVIQDVYACDKGEDSNKGTYIIFTEGIQLELKEEYKNENDETSIPIGQVLFVNKEGKLINPMPNKALDKYLWASNDLKDELGNDYVLFDNSGNIFILGGQLDFIYDDAGKYQGTKNTRKVFRWNPTDGLKEFVLGDIDDMKIHDFTITSDGEYIFVNAQDVKDGNGKYNDVYMFNVRSGTKETLFRSLNGDGAVVNTITAGPDGRVCFYANSTYPDGYSTNGNDGLFTMPRLTSGYSKANLKRYKAISWWNITEFVSEKLTGTAQYDYKITPAEMQNKNFDYTELLNFIKLFTNYKGEMDFVLDFYKDQTAVKCHYINDEGEINSWEVDCSPIYAEDEDGNALKNEAALKHLFETTSSRNAAGTLWTEEMYYDCVFSERQAAYGADSQSSFPIDSCLVKKDTTTSVFESWEVDFLKSAFAKANDAVFLSNDFGIWIYEDKYVEDAKKSGYKQARLLNIYDAESHFKKDPFPGDLKTKMFWPVHDGQEYGGENPAKHLPYAANLKGVAAISADKDTIYYQDGTGDTIDLLKNYSGNTITEIYAFNLDEETALINASITGGAAVTLCVDLETQAVTNLGITKALASMVRR